MASCLNSRFCDAPAIKCVEIRLVTGTRVPLRLRARCDNRESGYMVVQKGRKQRGWGSHVLRRKRGFETLFSKSRKYLRRHMSLYGDFVRYAETWQLRTRYDEVVHN